VAVETLAQLSWRGVHLAFGQKQVLRGFDLEVSAGESLVILGSSGSGKSVALRHLVGLVRPDRGQVLVEGRDLGLLDEAGLLEVRRHVAMVFQGGALFDSMDVAENVAFGLREHRPEMPPGDVAARVAEVLDLVALAGTERLFPSDLSGGMRKRVALARALAVGPRAVLYDEPTTGLDPVNTRRINALIRQLQRRLGVTSVVVTHDVESALAVADRLVFLRDGRVAWDGSTEQARRSPPPELAAFMAGEESPPSGGRETISCHDA